MPSELGLRERKKQETRLVIFEAAQELFKAKGFDAVSVAEIARAADVSEVTVFNYFPTKEDLFYGGMQYFEEELLEAVRTRPRGDSAIKAFRQRLLESIDRLRTKERIDGILKAAGAITTSPTLVARERDIVERYTQRLAELLAAETKSKPDDIEPLAVAATLIGTHRAIVQHVRRRVREGRRGAALVEETKAEVRRAFGRIERGLGDYAIRT
jgi:AcrR family transcriptional regulator